MTKNELQNAIIDLWNKDFSKRGISKVLNIPRTTVRRYIERLVREGVIEEKFKAKPEAMADGRAPLAQLRKEDIIWLSKHNCIHNKSYLEHYTCFINEKPEVNRSCYFDIETSGLQATFGIILAACILNGQTDEIDSVVISKKDLESGILDKRVVEEIIDILSRYDRIYGYYSSRFDIPFTRTRALYHNLEFPSFQSILHTDLYFLVRNRFKLHSNRLDVAAEALLGSTIKNRIKPEHWLMGLQGNKDALGYIVDHCLTPDHKVLMKNLEWKELGNLTVGDSIVGFDESLPINGERGRKYKNSTVESVHFTKLPVFNVELSTGEVLKVTENHKWLICNGGMSGGGFYRWATIANFRSKKTSGKNPCTKLTKLIPVVNQSFDYDSGYLSGIIDGEGTISNRATIAVAQRPGIVFDRIISALEKKCKKYAVRLVSGLHPGGVGKGDCQYIGIYGSLPQRLGFLQEIRPEKGIANLNVDSWGRLERRPDTEIVSVVDITPTGVQEIVQIGTSTKTLIVDGYPMHNCQRDVRELKRLHMKIMRYHAQRDNSI